MSKRCDVCGKGPQFGNRVSHANNRTRRRFEPNLQAVRVCTRCLKAGKIVKAA